MIKIQAANRNLPSVPALSTSLSLSVFPVAHSPCGACISRACFGQIKTRHVACGTYLNLLNGFITSFIHLIFPLAFNMVLQWLNIFNVAFNKSIVVGLIITVNNLTNEKVKVKAYIKIYLYTFTNYWVTLLITS